VGKFENIEGIMLLDGFKVEDKTGTREKPKDK
jgi:hypothetical protein